MKPSSFSFVLLVIVCISVVQHIHGSTPATSALIVFGDSTVDVGNNNNLMTLAKCNHPPYGRDFPHHKPTGRFSNGLLVTDFLASMLGLMSPTLGYLNPQATSDMILTGVSFASSASGFDDGTAKPLNVLTLGDQLKMYKKYQEDLISVVGPANASGIISNALHLISTGASTFGSTENCSGVTSSLGLHTITNNTAWSWKGAVCGTFEPRGYCLQQGVEKHVE